MSTNGKETSIIISAIFMISIMLGSMGVETMSTNIIPDIGSINVSKPIADVNEEIEFQVSLTVLSGTVNYYIYEFRDGSQPIATSNSNINHSFPFEGSYLVTITAVGGVEGLNDVETIQIIINNTEPQSSLSIPSMVYEDENATLKANGNADTDNDLPILKYIWQLGDGNHLRGSEVNYSWSNAGEYPVTLTIFDDQNALDTSTEFIQVVNVIPTADFNIQGANFEEDTLIVFNATSSYDTPSDWDRLQFYWNFSDGTVKRGQVAEHIYSESGTYEVSLVVMDDNGAKDKCSRLINIVNTPPSINIINPNISLLEGDTHIFNVNSSDDPTDFRRLTYNWSFGKDGWEASYLFKDNGIYPYSVSVSDPEGLSAVDTGVVNIANVPPEVSITSAQTIGNLSIRMTGTTNETVNCYYLIKFIENGEVIANYSHPRLEGNPNEQIESWPFSFDLQNNNYIEITNISTNVIDAANPAWLTFFFADGNSFTLRHVFNHDPEQVDSLNWSINLSDYYHLMSLTLEGSVFDPGLSDLVEGVITYNDDQISTFDNTHLLSYPCYSGITCFSVLLNPDFGTNLIDVSVWDDDGGTDQTKINLIKGDSEISFDNLAPQVNLYNDPILEDVNMTFRALTSDWENQSLYYLWNFGDNITSSTKNVNRSFSSEGLYLIRLMVSDGEKATTKAYLQNVTNKKPQVDILWALNTTEDEILEFESSVLDTESDKNDIRYLWYFDDKNIAYGIESSHSWAKSGVYNLTLEVIDDNGDIGIDTKPIIVKDKPPNIEGKFGFEAAEGTVVVMDVEVSDSVIDEQNLEYYWQINGFEFTGKKPTLWSNGRNYTANFTVIDQDGISSESNISIFYINTYPTVYPMSMMIYGPPQEVKLKAYTFDSFGDIEELSFSWMVNETSIPDGSGIKSCIPFYVENSGFYQGVVSVEDNNGAKSSVPFQIIVYMDSDGDGLSDEIESNLGTSPEDTDTDGDYITDWYENHILGTSAISVDTDMDGLYDGMDATTGYGELILGTDPLNNDTDNDNLTDGFEVVKREITITYDDQSTEIREVTSNPLKMDTDGDGLTDWQEYNLWIEDNKGLDPGDPDTNDNGYTDYEEIVEGITFDSDGDGLMDLEELHWTNTDPNKADTDEDGLSDSEEIYAGDDGYNTDPNCNDTDNDGLLDSAESYSITKEYGARKKIDSGGWRTFSFEKVIGITAVNATLTVSISVGEEAENPTDLTTKVYLNGEIIFENSTLGKRYFSNITAINDVVDEKVGTYTGEWKLEVHSTENCMLEEFKVEVTQRLDPRNPDCDNDGLLDGHEMSAEYYGWSTNPKTSDSDGDGWSDYHEILNTETNPLSRDTDGDKVSDSQDISPLKNLIIKIIPIEGHSGEAYWCAPVLATVIEINDRVVVTPHKRANKDPETKISGFYWFGNFIKTGSWDIDTTAEFKNSETGQYYNYYMDVPDDKSKNRLQIQSRLWSFHFWLGICSSPMLYTATGIVGGTRDYYINGVGHSQTFQVWQGSSWLTYKIETKGLDRVNTIAVYQNGSFYDDHYPSIERMNVITLEVTNTEGPFVNGINVILIPTNLFANTKLHAIIEQAVDENGVFDPSKVPSYLQDADFCGMDRNSESVSQNVESTITLEGVSPANAQKILELCTTSANETQGIIYLNKSVDAELLGIAVDVLDLIPFDGSIMQNDPQGAMPFGEAIIQFWQNPLKILHGVLVAITNFIVNLLNAIWEWGMKVIGFFIDNMGQAIEAAIKAIILMLAYILLAIVMLIMLIAYGVFFIVADASRELFDLSYNAQFFNIQLFKSDSNPFIFNSEINFEISWEYIEFIDLELPISCLDFLINGSTLIAFNFDILGLKKPDSNTGLEISSEAKPKTEPPKDQSTWRDINYYIGWELTPSPSASGSHYRILKDNIIDQDWQEWPSDGSVEYTVDTTEIGRYNYTIVFNDSSTNINSDSIWLYVVDLDKPISDHPHDKRISQDEQVQITWQIKEMDPSTQVVRYRIFKNGTGITGESGTDHWVSITFSHSENIIFTENSGLSLGNYNYSIEFEDEDGYRGNDTVWFTVIPSESKLIEVSYNGGVFWGLIQATISIVVAAVIPFIPKNYNFLKFPMFLILALLPFFLGLITFTAENGSAASTGYGTILIICGAAFIFSAISFELGILLAAFVDELKDLILDILSTLLTYNFEIYLGYEIWLSILLFAIGILGAIYRVKGEDKFFMYAAGISLLFTGLFYLVGGVSGLL